MMPRGKVLSVEILDDAAEVEMSDMRLDQISEMFAVMEEQPIVQSVELNVASTEENRAVVLVIFLGYFKLIFEPIQDQVAQYQDMTSQEQSELEQDLILLTRKQEMQRKIEEIRASGEERTIPQYDNSRRLMLDLHRILDSAVDYSLDFSQSTTQDSYIVLRPVTMSFQTHTYAQARAIVDALSESENMNQISDLSIRTNQGQDRDLVQTDLVITYFEVAS